VSATPPLRLPALVVIGGAQAGAFTVRQLLRAAAADRLASERIVVVDRDPRCEAAALAADPRVVLEVADWGEWLDRRLDDFPSEAHVVPYHWAPHLFFDWLVRQAHRAGLEARKGPAPEAPRGLPFVRATGDGDQALSYATWLCPPTCIEPALCPHTRGAKSWSLCADLETSAAGAEAIVFRCLHLVYGVGTVPLADLFRARDRLTTTSPIDPKRFLVATSSHCHALAATLEVGG
jgi:hypothetical protein